MLKILAMCDYVRVAEDEHVPEDAIELPSDEDGTILLSTIQAQFPGSTGLRFRNEETQTWRGVRLADGVLYPPVNGWGNTLYIVVSNKPGKYMQMIIDISLSGSVSYIIG